LRNHYNREEYWKDKPKKRQTKKQKNYKAKKTYSENRQKLLNLIGDKCLICGSTKRLIFHEINGKNHLTNGTSAFIYYFDHYKDFITLCYFHHKFLHQFAECRNWGLFQLLVSKLNGNQSIASESKT